MEDRSFVAQWGQDRVFNSLYGDDKPPGVFIEVGGYDGVNISNTYYLEKVKDWKGLLVEPNNDRYNEAINNRWCDLWDGCVYYKDCEVDYSKISGYSEMISGIVDEYHPQYRNRLDNEIRHFKLQTEVMKKPALTINSLMDKFSLEKADLLSLDCQTLELEVLKAYNVQDNPIKCILIDYNGLNSSELDYWFYKNGYTKHWKHENADEYLYVNNSIKWTCE